MEAQNPTQPQTQIVSPASPPIAPPTPEQPSAPKPKLSKWPILIGLFVILILISVGTAYFFLNSNKQVTCTTEAKLCPDGSSVGRTGPKCEFSKCPAAKTVNPTVNWKIYDNKEWQISYPESLSMDIYQDGAMTFTSFTNVTPIPDSDGTSSGMYLIIAKYTKTPSQSLKDYIDAYFKDAVPYIPPAQVITVDGISGLTVTYTSGIDGDHQTIFLPDPKNSGIVYYIEIFSADSKEYKQIGVEMLATFKFTDQASPTPTCRPRPACLDTTPKCLIPETSDMCPPTVTPSQ